MPETNIISIRSRQRVCKLDTRLLRKIAQALLKDNFALTRYELGIHFVEDPEMTQVNEHFLGHAGSTDVITFDYNEGYGATGRGAEVLAGELYICVNEAQFQAKRYSAGLASELLRYLIHGVLHLRGYDDKTAKLRRPMKREEDRLLAEISGRFPIERLMRP
jgi:probable rRNA maturation factor